MIRLDFIYFEVGLYITSQVSVIIELKTLLNSNYFFFIKKLSPAKEDNNSDETGNQIAPTLMPFSHSLTTKEPSSDDYEIKKTTDMKKQYDWSVTNDINPINEIVEFHSFDDKENELSTSVSDLDEKSDKRQYMDSEEHLLIQNTTESNLSSSSSSMQMSGKYQLLGYM